jgi:Putative peptidoglycan binding domain/LysM domain
MEPSESGSQSDRTIGQGDYEVKQGECMSSIAVSHGFAWDTLWNLPQNAELKRVRKDPNVLFPGDRITIPELRLKLVDVATDKWHRFKLVGVPAKLRLRFFDDWEPRAGSRYALKVDGHVRVGKLDANGQLLESIPPDTISVELTIDDDAPILLNLGTLDPISEISGIQGRLSNLDFPPGPVDNILGPKTRAALKRFQKKFGLTISGEADDATKNKLLEVHGS